MKHVQTGLLAVTLFLSAITFQSCQPQDGEVGPQGEQGATGAQGPAGPAGTANVQYSPWVTVTFTGSPNTGNLTAAAITQDILDKGDVRVYTKAGNSVVSLPYANAGATIHGRYYVGKIEFIASYSFSSLPIRYVIIPGGTSMSGRKAAIDYTDYEAVKRAYNLPD